jgi:hypothetical protein
MDHKKYISRREFLKKLSYLSGSSIIAYFLPKIGINDINTCFASSCLQEPSTAASDNHTSDNHTSDNNISNLYISKNGTPVTNMQKVIDMAGGITKFVNQDDVVVIKPNLQWPYQGYTHTEATKALIDIILNRSGGFTGEIIIAENVHWRDIDDTANCGWAVEGAARERNWPDMNYNELISWYNTHGYPNVTAAKMINDSWHNIKGPADGQGYIPYDYTISDSPGANGRVCCLSYPVIRSTYSDHLIDTKNGVWSGGTYTGQKVKLILLPTLNNHGDFFEDYAGVTSAVKCHIGLVKLYNGLSNCYNLHDIGYDEKNNVPEAVGEAVGELITKVVKPTLYITVAEWSGWGGRTSSEADHTKTIGLCNDPVTLDYWMGKNVLGPCASSLLFLNPANDCNWRKTLEGCRAKGVGILDETQMLVTSHDFDNPKITRSDIEEKIKHFQEGSATLLEVKKLVDNYMSSL